MLLPLCRRPWLFPIYHRFSLQHLNLAVAAVKAKKGKEIQKLSASKLTREEVEKLVTKLSRSVPGTDPDILKIEEQIRTRLKQGVEYTRAKLTKHLGDVKYLWYVPL